MSTLGLQTLRLWRRDPIAWWHDNLIDKPFPRQEEFLDMYARNEWSSLVACRDWGKSRLAAGVALHFLCTRFESLTFTSAPTWAQIKDAVWANIRTLWRHSRLPQQFPSWEVLTTEVKTPYPLWRAMGVTSNKPENTEGRHPGIGGILVLFDESKSVLDEFFDSIVGGMLGNANVQSKLVAIGTPGIPRGFFYRSHANDRKLWGGRMVGSAWDVPELRARAAFELERLGQENPVYQRDQLAKFSMAEGNVVIPLAVVERAIRKRDELARYRRDKRPGWPVVVSLDPSKAQGRGDQAVLGVRIGPALVRAEELQVKVTGTKQAEELLAEKTWEIALAEGAEAIGVDEPGLGLIVCRTLEDLAAKHYARQGDKVKIIRYKPGIAARASTRYQNRKSEDIFLMAERFRDNSGDWETDAVIPDIPDLVAQLVSWTHTDTRTSKTEVIDPSDSPDWADMCNISYAIEREFGHIRNVRSRGI